MARPTDKLNPKATNKNYKHKREYALYVTEGRKEAALEGIFSGPSEISSYLGIAKTVVGHMMDYNYHKIHENFHKYSITPLHDEDDL